MFPLIHDGKVIQLAAAIFPVNPALTWGPPQDGVQVGDSYDGTTYAHPASPAVAAPSRILSSADFMALFTPAQTAALWSADPLLMTGALRVIVQGTANLDSPDAVNLLTLAVSKGALSDAEKTRILAGTRPPAT